MTIAARPISVQPIGVSTKSISQGGVISFGESHPSIAYQNSLTDSASIVADGWTILTNTLIDSRGVSLTAAIDGGISHSSLLDAATKDILINQGQISFTIPTFYIATDTSGAANESTGFIRTTERFVAWDNIGVGSNFGGIKGNGNKTLGFQVADADTPWNMYLNSDDKPIDSVVTLSWENDGTVRVFINSVFIRTMINQGGDHVNMPIGLFNNWHIGNRFGNSEWMTGGFVKNLVISTQPVLYNHALPNGITFFGHSFVVSGVEESNVQINHMDALINYYVEKELRLVGVETFTVNAIALGGGYVSDIGATKLSTITASAAATNPDWYIAFMGTNDCLTIGLIPDANFQTELDLRIAELMVATTNPNMILMNINTLKYDSDNDSPGYVTEVFNKNEIIAGAPSRWEAAKAAGQGSIYVLNAYSALGAENAPIPTYIGQTTAFLDANLHPEGLGNARLGELAGSFLASRL